MGNIRLDHLLLLGVVHAECEMSNNDMDTFARYRSRRTKKLKLRMGGTTMSQQKTSSALPMLGMLVVFCMILIRNGEPCHEAELTQTATITTDQASMITIRQQAHD